MPYAKASQALCDARAEMARRYPFHTHLLRPTAFEADRGIETMAVMFRGDAYRYKYNPSFVARCSLPELVGVLHHEVNHILFGHVKAPRDEYPNRMARIIAEEVTVNEWVNETLPGDPLTLAQFPYLPANEDTPTRYLRLAARDDLPKAKTLDDHRVWTAEGSRFDGRDPDVHAAVRRLWSRLSAGRKKRALADKFAEFMRVVDREAKVQHLQKAAARPRRIHWQRVLASTIRPRYRQMETYRRPPRRLPHLQGVVPGRRSSPVKPGIMAVIDTSGSMRPSHLSSVNRELAELSRLGKVTVVECDQEIRAQYRHRGDLQHVRGRGGTDLRPPLAKDYLARHRPNVVVYFTDGGGRAPELAPKTPVIWCLAHPGRRPADWGRVVRMPD